MATDRIERLRLLMQAENIVEAPPENVPDSIPDISWEASPEIIWGSRLQNSARQGSGGGDSSSSDQDYAVRKTVATPPKKQRKVRALSTLAAFTDQDEEKPIIGDLGPLQIGYCPILAVTKFPYKFMRGSAALVEKVSRKYFVSSKIWDRKWTM